MSPETEAGASTDDGADAAAAPGTGDGDDASDGTGASPNDGADEGAGGEGDGDAADSGDDADAGPEPLTAESLTFPDSVQVNEDLRDEFLGVLNNAELSPQDRAQALVDLQVKAAEAQAEESRRVWQEMQDEWRGKAEEAHGEQLPEVLAEVKKVVEAYGGSAEEVQQLNQVFDFTGAGNNPLMINFLHRVAGELNEGKPASADGPGSSDRSLAERLYPNQGAS